MRGLTGPRVVIRSPLARDRDEFLAAMRASRKLHRGWSAPPRTPAAWAAFLRRYRRPTQVALLACRREDGRIVGAFMLMEIVRGQFRGAYLGYYAVAAFAGRGYMTEALGLVLRQAFGPLRLHRVEANIQPGNARSIALVGAASGVKGCPGATSRWPAGGGTTSAGPSSPRTGVTES